MLALPYAAGQFTLNVDESEEKVGCMPLQQQPNSTQKAGRYWFRSFSTAEKAYNSAQRDWAGLHAFSTVVKDDCVVGTFVATLPQKMQICFTDESRHAPLDTESNRRVKTTRQMMNMFLELDFNIVH